jgi:hypothetical protein
LPLQAFQAQSLQSLSETGRAHLFSPSQTSFKSNQLRCVTPFPPW